MLLKALFRSISYALLAWRANATKVSRGQGLVEYALILVLVAVVVIVVLTLLGPAIGNVFSNVICGIEHAQNGLPPEHCQ
jgi:pilus assembly protein Flp/PilA